LQQAMCESDQPSCAPTVDFQGEEGSALSPFQR
jgi:hypothetical protein